jgi:DNA-binding FrmR family transcriptional regulator
MSRTVRWDARGIHRMIEEEQYCIDILTQISALTAAEAKFKEASDAIARFVRS